MMDYTSRSFLVEQIPLGEADMADGWKITAARYSFALYSLALAVINPFKDSLILMLNNLLLKEESIDQKPAFQLRMTPIYKDLPVAFDSIVEPWTQDFRLDLAILELWGR